MIEFYHPGFATSVSGSGLRGGRAGTEAASDFIVEEEDASTDKGVSISHPSPVEFNFRKAFKTAKLADRKRVGVCGRKDEEGESTDSLHVSVEESEDQVFHILEVDTSDKAKALSTHLLKLTSFTSWDNQLIAEIERKLLRQSLRWPTNIFRRVCGKGRYRGIPHPKTSAKGVVKTVAISQWAARLHQNLV